MTRLKCWRVTVVSPSEIELLSGLKRWTASASGFEDIVGVLLGRLLLEVSVRKGRLGYVAIEIDAFTDTTQLQLARL